MTFRHIVVIVLIVISRRMEDSKKLRAVIFIITEIEINTGFLVSKGEHIFDENRGIGVDDKHCNSIRDFGFLMSDCERSILGGIISYF